MSDKAEGNFEAVQKVGTGMLGNFMRTMMGDKNSGFNGAVAEMQNLSGTKGAVDIIDGDNPARVVG
jgi:hypothetical protein